jgi:hypothetical protein
MGDAEVIDAALDEYLRSLIGDEYSPTALRFCSRRRSR